MKIKAAHRGSQLPQPTMARLGGGGRLYAVIAYLQPAEAAAAAEFEGGAVGMTALADISQRMFSHAVESDVARAGLAAGAVINHLGGNGAGLGERLRQRLEGGGEPAVVEDGRAQGSGHFLQLAREVEQSLAEGIKVGGLLFCGGLVGDGFELHECGGDGLGWAAMHGLGKRAGRTFAIFVHDQCDFGGAHGLKGSPNEAPCTPDTKVDYCGTSHAFNPEREEFALREWGIYRTPKMP